MTNRLLKICLIFTACVFIFSQGYSFAAQKPQGEGMYDVVMEQIAKKREGCVKQVKQLNKKIMELEKKQPKDIDSKLAPLVISLVDAQNKIVLADQKIAELQDRKEGVEFALQLESEIGPDSRFGVKKKTRDEMQATVDRGKYSESDRTEYTISAHDELQINVYGEVDLTKTVRVAADGTINYPLLGRVKVEGLTAQLLEERLGKLLSDGGYLMKPQVSVYVERFSSISILGEVRNPGSYELKGKLSIMDAIAQAGGFNIDADINNVKILRVDDGQQKTIQLKLGDIKKGLEGAEIALRANDTVFVEKIGKVSVLGEVTRPGTFELKDKMTFIEAIAMAGGFTDIAAMNRTRVIREDPQSKKKVIRIVVTDITSRGKKDKDIELLPGDIIYVPESLF